MPLGNRIYWDIIKMSNFAIFSSTQSNSLRSKSKPLVYIPKGTGWSVVWFIWPKPNNFQFLNFEFQKKILALPTPSMDQIKIWIRSFSQVLPIFPKGLAQLWIGIDSAKIFLWNKKSVQWTILCRRDSRTLGIRLQSQRHASNSATVFGFPKKFDWADNQIFAHYNTPMGEQSR